ncbi:MAG: molecular chaperone DnaJ [Labilithrix sp.]|nr:molecular chaperone DnaJ [Labilithrix sp.]MCW5814217.1 molecular chaperone DnaJ [Labilithrix sp.]
MNKPQEIELCGVCGGDGTIDNAWGQRAKCPSCHGNGKRRVDTGFHDVTKTKPSHHGVPTNRQGVVVKETKPTTPMGILLMNEVEKTALSADAKAKLVLEIYEHEASHGQVTKTFVKKLRKGAGIKAGG